MSPRIRLLLTLSLILNGLLFGIVLGDMSYSFVSPAMAPHAPADPMAGLSEHTRKLYQDTLQAAWHDVDASRAKIAEGKREALRLIAAPNFDAKAYMAQVKQLNDLHNQMKQHMAEAIAKLAAQSTPQERATLAEIVTHFSPPPPPPQHCRAHK